MKKFLVLYMAPTSSIDQMMKSATPEQQKAGMTAWTNWMDAHKAQLAEMGAPTGKNKRVTTSGVSDVRNEVCGYSIAQAETHDAAAAIFADSPHLMNLPGAYVEVVEIMAMPEG